MDAKPYEAILQKYFGDGTEAYLPHVSINCVVFKYEHPKLKVLFHSFPKIDQWYLPGGYVRKEESLEEAAYRNLGYLGIEKVFLRQVHTFGEVDRVQGLADSVPKVSGREAGIMEWVTKRFVTVVYYGLLNASNPLTMGDSLFEETAWLDADDLHNIGMDHANIAAETRRILSTELLTHPVVFNLLSERFTLNELRGLFEAILDRPIDRGTFRRKMLKLGILEQIDERQDAVGRPSHLYRFDQETYHRLLKEENKFGF